MRSVAVICARAIGALIIAVNLSALGLTAFPMFALGGYVGGALWASIAAPLGLVAVGVLMIVLSKMLGGLLTAGISDTASPGPDAQQILKVGTALIGLFFIASAVPDLFDAAWTWFAPSMLPELAFPDDSARIQRVATMLARAAGNAAIGGGLLWMARPVSGRGA